ncbi:MAG: GGDEF domain-containing protein, partial [bacterium]
MNEPLRQYLSSESNNKSFVKNNSLRELLTSDPDVVLQNNNPDDLQSLTPEEINFSPDCPPRKKELIKWIITQAKQLHDEHVDSLTGIFTRSYWERDLRSSLEIDDPKIIFMADIDHFKHFNDEYGHEMGDKVLEAVGQIFRESLSESATLVRYGGEEVLGILSQSKQNGLEQLETVREELACGGLFSSQPEPVTISIGVESVGKGENLQEAIRRADLALYESKSNGRDQLTVYKPYLDQKKLLYIWGVYRYLWDSNARFSVSGGETLEFCLYRPEQLEIYNWYDNESLRINISDSVNHPVRSLQSINDGYVILDNDGEVFHVSKQEGCVAIHSGKSVPIVELTGDTDQLHAVGLNNQYYHYRNEELVHAGALPSEWEYVASCDG